MSTMKWGRGLRGFPHRDQVAVKRSIRKNEGAKYLGVLCLKENKVGIFLTGDFYMFFGCSYRKDRSEAGQLLRSCLIFGRNLRLKAKQPSCL